MNRVELNSMSLNESKEYMKSLDEMGFRGEQLFSFFNRNKGLELEELTVFSKELREELQDKAYVNKVKILERFDSKIDGTKKYLFLLEDNHIVEGVFMEYEHGISVCISTQIGCKMGCSFCASTKDGLIRNLSPAEMLNQIYLMEKDQDIEISNIVLMGSGEPLDNYDNMIKFLNIIHDEKGHNISYRNISVSTCGIISKIKKLGDENIPITLSISLHSPFDDERRKIMPVSKGYTIEELIDVCRDYESITNRRITFEYTLIENVNDRIKDADELARLLRNLNCHINLIALNPIKEYDKKRPEMKNIRRFMKLLNDRGINATIRGEKGLDISASCGQLRRDYLEQ